jgi:hypothetical protein
MQSRFHSLFAGALNILLGRSRRDKNLDHRWQRPVEMRPDGSFPSPFSYAGGDGSTLENAIQILDVVRGIDFARGVHLWVLERFRGATVLGRSTDKEAPRFLERGNRHYVCVGVRLPNGRSQDFFFDDTEVFSRSPAGRR